MAQNQRFSDRKSCRTRPLARGRIPTSAATARASDRARSSCEVSAIRTTRVDEHVIPTGGICPKGGADDGNRIRARLHSTPSPPQMERRARGLPSDPTAARRHHASAWREALRPSARRQSQGSSKILRKRLILRKYSPQVVGWYSATRLRISKAALLPSVNMETSASQPGPSVGSR
jgi:hypothetical protein